jgi:hypothetical protein
MTEVSSSRSERREENNGEWTEASLTYIVSGFSFAAAAGGN